MHLSLFRTSAVRRARVLSPVCDCFFVLSAFDSGWVGGSLKESRSALLLARAMAYGALARGRFRVVAGARDGLPVLDRDPHLFLVSDFGCLVNNCSSEISEDHDSPRSCLSTYLLDTTAGQESVPHGSPVFV